jgi:glycine oxidase
MPGTARLTADVIVIGGGLIGLAVAVELSERRISVALVSEHRSGEASPAAAGMLAPSVERAPGPAHGFGVASRDRYPSYVEFLGERTGVRVPLNRLGILQVALSEKGVKGLRKSALPTTSWLDAKELRHLEPSLSHALGAMYNPDDGAVDNVALIDALTSFCAASDRITRVNGAATGVIPSNESCIVLTESGDRIQAAHVVLAAGAWAGRIAGAPLGRAVQPARGQLVSYPTSPLRHVAYGPSGYIVPRGGATIGGSTMESVGFDSTTTVIGLRKVRTAAEEICPALATEKQVASWAGLRPVTPDMLPIIGPDPEHPSLIYACGHSRNGVLMAPLTGDLIADLVTQSPLSHDLSQFRPGRF